MYAVLIANLDPLATEDELRGLVAQFGTMLDFEVLRAPSAGLRSGARADPAGEVGVRASFADASSAQRAAAELHGYVHHGRRLRAALAP